ncbi:MAG TPA: phosphoenolpyruvate carboxykinase (GTP) [Rhabdochlamydiaceae bacterium]|nr:phosphoenolpyruvate carboxykinase (GTP) [Rhabdochlamydiaceae bacterium]
MSKYSDLRAWTKNEKLIRWIDEIIVLCKPSDVYLWDGNHTEYEQLCREMVDKGIFVSLNPEKRPKSFWCHSTENDVARVEDRTFICSKTKEEAGPTNNWKDPEEMRAVLMKLFSGCMQGRTLYVLPFSMGPIGSPMAHIGVQITDSPYVACSMDIMTRMGKKAIDALGNNEFVACLHSVGAPLSPGQKDVDWPCCADQKYIVHFPEERSIWSFGSGYGGNALLGKKSFALRIASVMARDQGWMAEHMLILGLTNPEGKKKYFSVAFPSQCGKTNLAMLSSSLPGWKVECVGDDIAWMKFGADGQLYAINPEAGFFGVAPGTSFETNPNAMKTISKNTIFTNVALTQDKDVWWEGMTKIPPSSLIDWKGNPWTSGSGTLAAHSNARFTVPASQCPIIDNAWEKPEGVPISGIIFGGRRPSTIPLVSQSVNWQHGVFLGASISSETTAAAAGAIGKLRHDPFAMLPFCGYNMGDYFAHWLHMGLQGDPEKLPQIFYVNWFRKSKDGSWLWPGFTENIRVLKWIFERCTGKEHAVLTPIGYLPIPESIDVSGLNISDDAMKELFHIEKDEWLAEVQNLKHYFSTFGKHLPEPIKEELHHLEKRLKT